MKRFILAFVAIIALGVGIAYAGMNKVDPPSLGGNSAFRNSAPGAVTDGNNYFIGRKEYHIRITDVSTAATEAHPVPQGGWISAFYCSMASQISDTGSHITLRVPDAQGNSGSGSRSAVSVSVLLMGTNTNVGQQVGATGLSQQVTEDSFFVVGTDGGGTGTSVANCIVFIDPMPQ